MALGVALVVIAMIGGLVLLIGGDGDGDADADSRSQGSAPQVSELQDRFLDRTVVDRDEGISVHTPASWNVTKKEGVTSIESKDGCLVMQLSAPVAAERAKALREDGIDVLRSQYRNAKVQHAARSGLGGIPTRSDTISFTDRKANTVQVVHSLGTGKRNAYLTQVVVSDPACQGDLQLAQLMLGSLEFTK